MPYVKQEERDRPYWEAVKTPGLLNYKITDLINDYLVQQGVNYTNLNACIGVLECAKLELYRRVAAPYEDKKIIENGDVYSV